MSEHGSVIDHVLLFASDLDRAARIFEERSGIAPQIGGAHPDIGTTNALASMGESYLELIASDRSAASLPDLAPFHYAVRSDDIRRSAAKVESLGFTVDWMDGQRETPDGAVLHWRTFEVIEHDFGGAIPFFIDWGSTPNPANTAPGGLSIPHLTIVHTRSDELETFFHELGIPVSVHNGEADRLTLTLMSPKGELKLSGPPLGWRAALLDGT